jgi:hypothetical protein
MGRAVRTARKVDHCKIETNPHQKKSGTLRPTPDTSFLVQPFRNPIFGILVRSVEKDLVRFVADVPRLALVLAIIAGGSFTRTVPPFSIGQHFSATPASFGAVGSLAFGRLVVLMVGHDLGTSGFI